MDTCYPADYTPAITYFPLREAHGRVSNAPGSHKLVEVKCVHWPVEPRGSVIEGSPIMLLSRVHWVENIYETDHGLHSLRESMPPSQSSWTCNGVYCDCIAERYALIR